MEYGVAESTRPNYDRAGNPSCPTLPSSLSPAVTGSAVTRLPLRNPDHFDRQRAHENPPVPQLADGVVSPARHGPVGQARAAVSYACGNGGHAGQHTPVGVENCHRDGGLIHGPVT